MNAVPITPAYHHWEAGLAVVLHYGELHHDPYCSADVANRTLRTNISKYSAADQSGRNYRIHLEHMFPLGAPRSSGGVN